MPIGSERYSHFNVIGVQGDAAWGDVLLVMAGVFGRPVRVAVVRAGVSLMPASLPVLAAWMFVLTRNNKL